MKKKTVAVTTIFFTFFGFAWMVETKDRFNRGIIETEDPTQLNIKPVQYGETEEVEERSYNERTCTSQDNHLDRGNISEWYPQFHLPSS